MAKMKFLGYEFEGDAEELALIKHFIELNDKDIKKRIVKDSVDALHIRPPKPKANPTPPPTGHSNKPKCPCGGYCGK